MSTTSISSYEQACAEHSWDVPARYNIASDVCEKHPRGKLAMVHEDFQGTVREVRWGEIQDNAKLPQGLESGCSLSSLARVRPMPHRHVPGHRRDCPSKVFKGLRTFA